MATAHYWLNMVNVSLCKPNGIKCIYFIVMEYQLNKKIKLTFMKTQARPSDAEHKKGFIYNH